MKAKHFFLLFPLFTMLVACVGSSLENGVEESPKKIDYTYRAEVRVLLNPTELINSEGYKCEFYSKKGFSELILSQELFDKTCHEMGQSSHDIQNEMNITTVNETDVLCITVNGVDTLSSKIFLEKLMELTEDSIVQSIIQPMDDSLAVIESVI